MCGVAGIFAYRESAPPVDEQELLRIREAMIHRGPDGAGLWISPDRRVGLAHRRLAIIDLSEAGAQPMSTADGNFRITFNGEIYNYRELRKELEAKGYRFHSNSDTEVLLHLYADRGPDMVHALRGMYAFGIWDERKKGVFLARDPFGIKPLYYADDGWTCRFASQVKALLAGGKVSRLPEAAGLAGFYIFGSVPEPYTLYQEIRAVPAGCYQWVDANGPQVPVQHFSIAQIWAEARQTAPVARSDLAEVVRQAVLDSARHHLLADVPVGAFLSAGIDSGALVGVMAEILKDQSSSLSTITLAFEEFRNTDADESPLAEKVARHYGVNHTIRIVGEQEFHDDLSKIFDAMDQPSIDGINTWFISKAASEAGLKVAVSGLGGDELFGGYPSFRDIPKWVRLLWLPSHIPGLGTLMEQVHGAFSPLFPRINPKASGMLRYGGTYPGAYLLRRGLFLPRELPDLIGTELAQAGLLHLQPLKHIRSQLTNSSSQLTAHGRISTLEATLYMRNQLLRDTDWASMAHSLEVRTPLVDATLLRQLAGPLATATSGNHKQLLARCPGKALPDEVADRAKSGFSTPISAWQQRGDSTQVWRKAPALARKNCPWARRWGYSVASQVNE
ncbi:MAG: asparagine synthase (glutamine-hydrolyzing) [Proteobacteria bacterium]|nr:asparagine synthase (glutamine-hydrolyzing) [Pseudomonadota bacterium]